jgi:hypothetical protein
MSFKPGDKAVVTIVQGEDQDGDYRIMGGLTAKSGIKDWIGGKHLSPLPPTVSPEAQAVLDAALACDAPTHTPGAGYVLRKRVAAYRASIAPPIPSDPIADLIQEARGVMAALGAMGVPSRKLKDALEVAERSRQTT